MKILYIKPVKGKGRGVFCNQDIRKDEIIEKCHMLVIPAKDVDNVSATNLVDYFFNFNRDENSKAIALGFGSLYNHSLYSNAAYILKIESKIIEFYALEEIKSGTEITINYGGEKGKEYNIWFESRNILMR